MGLECLSRLAKQDSNMGHLCLGKAVVGTAGLRGKEAFPGNPFPSSYTEMWRKTKLAPALPKIPSEGGA